MSLKNGPRRVFNALPYPLQRILALLAGRAEITSFNPSYHQDWLATNHWGAYTADAKFQLAYKNAVRMGLAVDPKIEWRAHVACWAASNGAKLGGAFVECGVNRGFLSRIILDYLDTTPPSAFYLLDTFEGFSEAYLSETEAARLKQWQHESGRSGPWQRGMYDQCYEDAVKTFADHQQVRIIRGAVPETLPLVDADRIAYLSLDMNCAAPEIAALEYFWPKLVPGAYVVVDDYGWLGHEEQRDAYDAWATRNSVPLLSLPTGQCLFVKC
ncbi:MAG: methyltransferase [Rhodocyclales bacterium]|nr:methyltransferase [Rhodocyclales bacterium]